MEVSEGGRVIGRMPLSEWGWRDALWLGLPPLTPVLGPAINDGEGSPTTRLHKRMHVTRELLERLPKAFGFWQKFHRGVTDVLPFQVERFRTQVQFTFELHPAPEELLWAALRDKTRNVIRKSQRRFAVEELADAAEFTHFYLSNLRRLGRAEWNGGDVMAPLIEAALQRRAGTMLGIRQPDGNLAAAIFCAHDTRAAYYSMSTRRLEAENGAIPMLIWEALRRSASRGLTFDFDGVSSERTIGLYAGFGGVITPRFVATRSWQDRIIRRVRRGMGLRSNTFGS